VDEAAKKWFMDTAARKWKDYKLDLKEKYFDETLTDEQMKERLKNILNDDDISDLIKFWRSPKCQVRNSSYDSLFSITCLSMCKSQ
jgi:predicted component of type VI protein secretion system